MKNIMLLLIGAAAGYFGREYIEPWDPWLAKEAPPIRVRNVTEPIRPMVDVPLEVICRTCRGEGWLSYVDSSRRNRRYACKICGNRGHNVLRNMPSAAHTCPDCHGMGRIENAVKRAGGRIDARRCARCIGQGWILPRTGLGDPGQTPNVDDPQKKRFRRPPVQNRY